MCGLSSEDAQSSSGEALNQCIYEVFDVMSYTETILLKNSIIRVDGKRLKELEPTMVEIIRNNLNPRI